MRYLRNIAACVPRQRGGVESIAFCNFWTKSNARPQFDVNEYWGPSKSRNVSVEDETIRNFKIEYPQEKIIELKRKLSEKYEFSPPLEGTKGHEYGMNSNRLQEYIRYWRDDYLPRWDERLKLLNSLPHFKTNIQG